MKTPLMNSLFGIRQSDVVNTSLLTSLSTLSVSVCLDVMTSVVDQCR